jgi:NADPH:quinone reductase-like Zn-dependent oxidoreductase
VVEQVGERVTRFKVGDAVFGGAAFKTGTGTHCELLAIGEDEAIALKPEAMSFEEAAGVPFGCFTAGYFLHTLGKLKAGERVLIVGASGAVGCAAVQMAAYAGATVVGVCSGGNVELVESLGAERVIDYTKEDYTDPAAVGEPFDVVFDTVGATSLIACRRSMTEDGRFLAAVMGLREVGQLITNGLRKQKLRTGVDPQSPAELERCRGMIEEGAYRAVIDQECAFEEIVEAYRRVDSDRKRGSVVVKVGG